MHLKHSTKQSSGSHKDARDSRAVWLKSLNRGDKVWVCPFSFSEFEELADVDYSFQQETFGGFCGEGFGEDKAWVKCEYDGGRLVSTKDFYPTKQAAQNANAPKIIAAIKKKRRKLFDELSKWLKLQQKYQNMLPNTSPIVEKAAFANQ
jgi:hypothetical protein